MKKLLAVLLTLVLVFSLCGCLGGNNDDVRGDITSGNQSETEKETEKEPEFSLGKATNNTYKNDFLGISCTLPSEFVFYTDKQMLELNNIVSDVMDEEAAEKLKNANIIYDMYAVNQAAGESVNINLEKLNAAQIITLDIKKTLEAQINTITSSFKNMGYTDINVAYKKTAIDGKEFDSLAISSKVQGIPYYSTVFSFRKGNYLASVTFGSLQTDKTNTFASYFDVK